MLMSARERTGCIMVELGLLIKRVKPVICCESRCQRRKDHSQHDPCRSLLGYIGSRQQRSDSRAAHQNTRQDDGLAMSQPKSGNAVMIVSALVLVAVLIVALQKILIAGIHLHPRGTLTARAWVPIENWSVVASGVDIGVHFLSCKEEVVPDAQVPEPLARKAPAAAITAVASQLSLL